MVVVLAYYCAIASMKNNANGIFDFNLKSLHLNVFYEQIFLVVVVY